MTVMTTILGRLSAILLAIALAQSPVWAQGECSLECKVGQDTVGPFIPLPCGNIVITIGAG